LCLDGMQAYGTSWLIASVLCRVDFSMSDFFMLDKSREIGSFWTL
jgi:hypothetical protein